LTKQDEKFNRSYFYSIITLSLIICFLGFGCALAMNYLYGWSFSLTGTWISCIGFIVFAWSWANPNQIAAWDCIGIDTHPKDKDLVLSPAECKKYSVWEQPNRLKLMTSILVLSLGGFLQAIGSSFNI
jgi:hypothetical protein